MDTKEYPLTITESALNKVADIIANEGVQVGELCLRVFVQGGGCSGFQYGFNLEADRGEDDFVLEYPQAVVLVDALSLQYLSGAELDYTEDLRDSQFVVRNPHAVATCGCGSSFSI